MIYELREIFTTGTLLINLFISWNGNAFNISHVSVHRELKNCSELRAIAFIVVWHGPYDGFSVTFCRQYLKLNRNQMLIFRNEIGYSQIRSHISNENIY